MPQLDLSYYVSQITWLLIFFGGFFCISKFLILPQLNRIVCERNDLVSKNISFADETLEKAKNINNEFEHKLQENNKNIQAKISQFVKQSIEHNNKKINDLKKQLQEEENKTIFQIKQELQKSVNDAKANVVEVIIEIIKKVYQADITEQEINCLMEKINK